MHVALNTCKCAVRVQEPWYRLYIVSGDIDTSSPLGEAIFTIISAMSKLERDIIAERVKGGCGVRPEPWGSVWDGLRVR